MYGRPSQYLTGKVAVVTGAGSGIGRAVAIALASAGANVVAIGRTRSTLEATADLVSDDAVDVQTHVLDLTRDDDVTQFGHEMTVSGQPLDVLVHAAGRYVAGPVEGMSTDAGRAMFATNVSGPERLTEALLPLLQRRGGDVVVLNSSVVFDTSRTDLAYTATKQALLEFTDTLRARVNRDAIRVTSVYPGRTATPMQAGIARSDGRLYRSDRLIQPEDIAAMVLAAISLPRTAEVTDIRIRPMIAPDR